MSVSVDALLRYGSTAVLVCTAVFGVGSFIRDKYFPTLSEEQKENLRKRQASAASSTNPDLGLTAAGVADGMKKVVRVTALPVMTIVCVWSLVRNPEYLTQIVPSLFGNYSNAAVSNFVPLYAKNLREAFELGKIYREHHQARAINDQAAVQKALEKATTLLGRAAPVTSEQLAALPKTLSDLDDKKGPFQRLLGILSLANIAQAVATVLIAGTAGPFVVYVFGERLKNFAVAFYELVLLPLHHLVEPAYEPLFYVATAVAAVESARYPRGDALSFAGTGAAFTSIAMFLLSWAYTTMKISGGSSNAYLWTSLTSWMFTAYTVPLAILHQSKFLAYLAAAGAAVAFGFSAFSTGTCLFIGFDSEIELARCTVGCLLLNVASVALRAHGIESRYIDPFQGPVSTISTSVFFLGLLILAEVEKYHLQFIVAAVGHIVGGQMLALPGMSNAAQAWLGIYGFSRFCRYFGRNADIVSIFVGSVALYMIAKFLQRNPQYVAAAIFGQ